MPESHVEVLRSTLDLLILKALSWGPPHGYAVARWIESVTAAVFAALEAARPGHQTV